MPELTVTVRDKHAKAAGTPVIVCGNSDYTVRFSFDSEWADCPTKTARFVYHMGGAVRYTDVLFAGDSVSVPVLRDADEVEIGVYAGSLSTSTPACIPCARCITDGEAVRDPPVTDIYNQLTERLAELQSGRSGRRERLRTWGSAFTGGMTWAEAAMYKWRDAG
ncbi:MAG: hypothetical protein IKS42_09415 [Oscillospiraceae bacterium]|nr:hypothetical protein [Oscillospiraceae bacterium]